MLQFNILMQYNSVTDSAVCVTSLDLCHGHFTTSFHYLQGDCGPRRWLVQSVLRPSFKAQPNVHVSPKCAIVSVWVVCAMLPWAKAGV